MLEIDNVTKTFGDIVALRNVSFEIDEGEFIFIVGPSGAGKTTLVNLILGMYPPDNGKIVFGGEDITELGRDEIPEVRQRIGVVFQDFKVLDERTVRENVEVALAVKDVPQEEWDERVDRVLELAGLSERSELFPAQLSGGELQRVSLSRALVVNPDLIIADEPTGNLDWDTADKMMDLFEKINKEGKTIIVATHHQLIVDKLKKRVIELKKGELEKDDGKKEKKKKTKKDKKEEDKKEEEEKKEDNKKEDEKEEKEEKTKKVKVEEVDK